MGRLRGKAGAGSGRAHRDINGRHRSARASRSRQRRSRVNTSGVVGGFGNGELVTLRVDYVDVGAVDATDLVAPFGLSIARNMDSVNQIRRRNVQSQWEVRWRPGHKVPQIETEVGGIGINAGPLDCDGGPGCVGGVRRRTCYLDGGY